MAERMQPTVLGMKRKIVSQALVPTKQRDVLLRTNENAAVAHLVLYPDEKPLRRCDVDPNVLTTGTGDLQDGKRFVEWMRESSRQGIVRTGFINLFPCPFRVLPVPSSPFLSLSQNQYYL